MSFKAVSAIGGTLTTIGGGLGIYLLKNNTNNPPQKTSDAVNEKEWITLLNQDPKYTEAKKTGKIVNFVTYKENKTADNNANYFLMHIEDKAIGNISNFSELEIQINGSTVLEDVEKDDQNFPLFCIENGDVDNVQDLNLNNLKKFSHDCLKKYILVSLQNNERKWSYFLQNNSLNKNSDNHSNINVKLIFMVSNIAYEYCGKISKIFHKHYQPTINNSNS